MQTASPHSKVCPFSGASANCRLRGVVADSACIFYAEKSGEARATIKYLRRITADSWHVSQWNLPDDMKRDFTLPRREWGVCHRVLGKFSRR